MVDQLYNAFVGAFGNTNPLQVFSLIWPGTTLDAASYASADTYGPLPPNVEIAQSQLFDLYYPVATITQADGTRVSDRYRQALEHYGPVPNEDLLKLQQVVRDRLDQVITVVVDGKEVSMTLLDQFNLLNSAWVQKREAWGRLKQAELKKLRDSGDADWWDEYILWYENIAGSYIDDINAAYNRLIAEFPLTAYQDAIAILDTNEAASLLRAKQDVRNASLPVPHQIGTDFMVATAIPKDWGNTLVPSTKFTDMLASPEAQQKYLDLCVTQLSGQISAWNAVLAQVPPSVDKEDLANALEDFRAASAEYSKLTRDLINAYTANAVTAVKIYVESQLPAADQLANANALLEVMDPDATPLDAAGYDKIAEDIAKGMEKLNGATGSMVAAGTELGQKATAYLQARAGEGLREIIAPVLAQLTSQLTILQQQIANLQSSAYRTIKLREEAALTPPPPSPGEFPSVTDSLLNRRWTEVTMMVETAAMESESSTSTSFSQNNWNVNLFFGSAGGQNSEASENFAAEYMSDDSSIQIGMLATKVVIQRPWMHPEIFNLSQKFFRVIKDSITTNPKDNWVRSKLVPQALGGGGGVTAGTAGKNCEAVNRTMFPAYPVALLIVKDVTIKIRCKSNRTQALQSYSEQNSSQGGGFLCFSVSREQASSASNKSANSYAMAGDYVFRIPAPQVVGTWLQIAPDDKSEELQPGLAESIARSLGFISKLKEVVVAGPLIEEPPRAKRK